MLFTNDATHREYESPILIRRDELGIRMVDLCRECGVTSGTIYDLAYGVSWPVYVKTWSVKPYVLKLIDILDISLEDAFPLFFCKLREHQSPSMELFVGQYTLDRSDPWGLADDSMYATDILRNGISRLTAKERIIVRLAFIEDMSVTDIAASMNLTTTSIWQYVHRINRKLRHPFCRYSNWEMETGRDE